ncbi:hypothetical protein RO3G_14653 [Rhizopus delemar RA 99-880]|uniref:Uncharacterized protein n=1 Tax=Rhizopus delemar (strain RA 99-880 / ATCC MYA-4621 / FGSC 9543 / NRRL 43880) TaxID=246409 RepID=I1CNB2_RHIO9|nr:hypothetical protein RO3G_14653 [Rhizopus delemar RA 99-880]|eukprot:EIE89942.1 hypothetical protein RO3G_14653 [Rhizopus delemar RA 99-880]
MSNNSSEPYDLLDFNNQATRTGFQERLLNAHNASRDQQIENNIFNDLSEEDDEEELRKKVLVLQQQVDRMENHVVGLEERLRERRERRQKEAGLTNMTPEERARFVEEEEERDDTDIPDLDVIFEYMLLVGSSATSNTNDLSQADFLKPDTELRKEAMLDQEVLQQTEYSFIKFTEAKNILETQMDSLVQIAYLIQGFSSKEAVLDNTDRLEANVRDHVKTQLGLDVIAPSASSYTRKSIFSSLTATIL